MTTSLDILDRLIRFDTTSARSNLPMIDHVEDFLKTRGFRLSRFNDPAEPKAGLLAEIGPDLAGGLLLSAHSDVVPVDGQHWTRSPFQLTAEGDLLYGRGTTDMKGALAEMLALADAVHDKPLKAPLRILLTYDEEIGCVGIDRMKDWLKPRLGHPGLAIVGEPTELQIGITHKGKRSYRAQITGQAGHSALAPRFASALHAAVDFVTALRNLQSELRGGQPTDGAGALPFSTVHVGRLESGTALNIVPDHATLLFEFRHLVADDPDLIADQIAKLARQVTAPYGDKCQFAITPLSAYPGLSISPQDPAVTLAQSWSGGRVTALDFGTEAGVLSDLGLPALVCGPGSMAGQGHKADEYISRAQLAEYAKLLDRAAQHLLLPG